MRTSRLALASALALLVIHISASTTSPASPLPIHAVDATHLGSPGQWQFLEPILRNVDVVGLPEPIHMTHEFPIVRLGIITFLHEHMGFHVLAMEGSLVDAWATQDRFLTSPGSDQNAADAQLGLFPLWNTPEIRGLFRYEAATWSTRSPLYITAYDVQPGTGKGTHGVEAFRLLANRLATYAPPPANLDVDMWLNDLRPLTNACRDFTSSQAPHVAGAIQQLELWIAVANPAVAARFPHVPSHAAALRLLPANLRDSLALCGGMASSPSANYKALRDGAGAAFAEHLLAASAGRKLMLWAHWSHLSYTGAAGGTSVGRDLRQTLGTRLYTILPLAERGTAIVIFPNGASDDDVGLGWLRPDSDAFSSRMQALSAVPFFLDLHDPAVKTDEAFAGDQSVWIESRRIRLPLIQDADAIVWIKRVSPPHLRLPVLLVMGGLHYRAPLMLVASLLLVLGLAAALARRRRASR